MSFRLTQEANEFLLDNQELNLNEFQTPHSVKSHETETCLSISECQKIHSLFPTMLKPQICLKHQRGQDILCLTDRKLICSHCALFDYNQNHKFILLEKARSDAVVYLQKTQKLQKYEEGDKRNIISTEKKSLIRELTEKKHNLMREIKKYFYKIYRQLENIESQHYKTISEEFNQIQHQINQQFQTLSANKYANVYKQGQSFCEFYMKYVAEKELPSVEQERTLNQLQIQKIKSKLIDEEKIKIKSMAEEAVQGFCKNFVKLVQPVIETFEKQQEKENEVSRITNVSQIRKNKSAISLLSSAGNRPEGNKNSENQLIGFLTDLGKDTLDLSGFNLKKIPAIISEIKQQRDIPRLKLSRMNLTDLQLHKLIPLFSSSQFVNLSSNNLTETSLQLILECIPAHSKLQSINLSKNKEMNANTREAKAKIQEIKHKLNIHLII